MTKFTWPSRKVVAHQSRSWHKSNQFPGVRFAIRSISLGERIELAKRIRDLCARDEFLAAGGTNEQLEATRNELLVKRLFLEWGLLEVAGLEIDGRRATTKSLVESGPEALSDEIAEAIKAELGLTEEERKNS